MRARRLRAAAVAVALVAAAGSAVAPTLADAACFDRPKALAPSGSAPQRFTMMIRVNKAVNASVYANRDASTGGLGHRIRPQDVFVVNTRFNGSTPNEWAEIVSILRGAFPCNRIVALNGLGSDPYSPGYAYALAGSGQLWATLTDWETGDWNAARATNVSMAGWTDAFGKTRKRVRRWVGGTAGTVRGAGEPVRTGIAPLLRKGWDYGELARSVSGPHRRFGRGLRGVQSVQTQDSCAYGGAGGAKRVAGRLIREYKRSNFKRVRRPGASKGPKRFRSVKQKWRTQRRNLAFQVSFSDTPNPAASMAILRTSSGQAADCTRSALKRGMGAFLYWASPISMRQLFATPYVCGLRPPPPGTPC